MPKEENPDMELSLHDTDQYNDTELSEVVDQNDLLNLSERLASLAAGLFIVYKSFKAFQRQPMRSIPLVLSGGYLLYRGASGKCSVYDQLSKANEQLSPIIIETSLEVDKPREEVYAFWRKLQNLPLFMRHIKSINELDAKRSVWELDVPGNLAEISWEARIIKEDKNNLLSWSSAEDAMIENSGRIKFQDLPDKKGTRLDVFISYRPPVSALGSGIATLLNPVFKKMIENDITEFKTYIEKT